MTRADLYATTTWANARVLGVTLSPTELLVYAVKRQTTEVPT